MMVSEMISTRTLQSPSKEQMAEADDLLNTTSGEGCESSDLTVFEITGAYTKSRHSSDDASLVFQLITHISQAVAD